ncbi:MAG: hypothetical protein DRO16_04545 [Thermoprotei archaeon]|nr:MAG: hypothetical protein DRO16_04545 [Thermoprotei archaeon]
MVFKVLGIDEVVDRRVVEWLLRQVLVDPATHSYALYDLIYQPRNTRFNVVVRCEDIIGYVLEWGGWGLYAIHFWGSNIPSELIYDVLKHGLDSRSINIHIHSNVLEPIITEIAKKIYGEFEREVFIDMVVDRKSFKPYNIVRDDVVVRILNHERDASEFMEIKERQSRRISLEDARNILKENVYVGVFKDNKLVSMAGAIIRLRDAWIIADVYTLPEQRGRGYAKLATSKITSLGLDAGVKKVALHVNSKNTIAIRVYKRLGYYETSRKTWLIVKNKYL